VLPYEGDDPYSTTEEDNSSVTQVTRALDAVMDETEMLEICGGVVSAPAISTARIQPQFDSRPLSQWPSHDGYVPAVSQPESPRPSSRGNLRCCRLSPVTPVKDDSYRSPLVS
jgi:hypothetical protein